MAIIIVDSILTLLLVILILRSIFLIVKNFKTLDFERFLLVIPVLGFIQLFHTQILCFLMPDQFNPATNYIIVAYMIMEYFILQSYLLWTLGLSKKRSFAISLILPLILIIGYSLNKNHIKDQGFHYILTETGLLIISALLIISKSILDDNKKNLFKDSDFLVSSGILITFIYLMPFYAIRNFLLVDIALYIKVQTLNIVLGYCIFYSLLIYSIKWKIKIRN
jgi:hypothetical protein